jgi:sulfur relay (sulfurtransferase) DsrC/TusE family protein
MLEMLEDMEDNFPPVADAAVMESELTSRHVHWKLSTQLIEIYIKRRETTRINMVVKENQHTTWVSYRILRTQMVKCLFANAEYYQCGVRGHSKRALSQNGKKIKGGYVH